MQRGVKNLNRPTKPTTMKKSKRNKTAGASHVAHQRLVSCPFDDKMSVGKGFGRLTDHGTKSGETYTDGSVATPHGIVLAYSQGDADSFHHTRLDVVKDGMLYAKLCEEGGK
jgi:hypothetical protein